MKLRVADRVAGQFFNTLDALMQGVAMETQEALFTLELQDGIIRRMTAQTAMQTADTGDIDAPPDHQRDRGVEMKLRVADRVAGQFFNTLDALMQGPLSCRTASFAA
jgi:hypothetical protein